MAHHHKITVDDMLTWLDSEARRYVTYASCSSARKRLEVMVNRTGYRVTHGDDVVYLGMNPGAAVDAYNDIFSPPAGSQ